MSTTAPAPPAPADQAPESAADAVFYGIMNGLEGLQFVPGQRLVEVDLAARFGVGRNSVREALQRLAAEGIVEILRHKGAAIRALSRQETMDVLDVAERMTGLLARSAARAVAAGQPRQAVARALDLLRAADREQDADAFARARRSFYRALLETGGSRELRRLFPSIHMPIVHAQHRLAALQKLRLRDYRAIGKTVLDGDEAAADEAAVAHVRNVREEILRKLAAG
jgi:DNA-binding GntR family transcriptional regulator